MYIEQLKSKYKQILSTGKREQEEEENYDLKPLLSRKNHNARVLTQYNQNTYKNSTHHPASSALVLALKQRIAQSTCNLQKKENQFVNLKEELVRKDEKIRLLEQQVIECRLTIDMNEQRVIDQKVISTNLDKDIQKLKQRILQMSMDCQLAHKQSDYYKKQASKTTKQKNSYQKTIESFQKKIQQMQGLKSENTHLRNDTKRMQDIVNQMCQKRISTDVTKKHYLGKPIKEASMWFSQNLVGEVQHFLKKEQVGQGNKKFLNNLVKFIAKNTSMSHQSKVASSNNSRVKSSGKSSHARSASMCEPGYSTMIGDMGTSAIRKTQGFGMSALKKSLLLNKYKKIDSRKYTSDSLLIIENDDQSICDQILKEYRKVLKQALGEKNIKPKVILDLTDEMSNAITHMFDSQEI